MEEENARLRARHDTDERTAQQLSEALRKEVRDQADVIAAHTASEARLSRLVDDLQLSREGLESSLRTVTVDAEASRRELTAARSSLEHKDAELAQLRDGVRTREAETARLLTASVALEMEQRRLSAVESTLRDTIAVNDAAAASTQQRDARARFCIVTAAFTPTADQVGLSPPVLPLVLGAVVRVFGDSGAPGLFLGEAAGVAGLVSAHHVRDVGVLHERMLAGEAMAAALQGQLNTAQGSVADLERKLRTLQVCTYCSLSFIHVCE